jgi:hypothetical protein
MHVKIFFFEVFFVVWKYNMIFFFCFLETWSYAWKQRHISFFMFWWKPGILIPDLYFYGIKIQPDINQNDIEKCTGKSQIFPKWFLNFFYFFKLIWVGLGQPILIGAGPGPSIWAGPLLQGWTQPSRVGWADDPACGHHRLVTVLMHSNR